jgi:hypothetical protein
VITANIIHRVFRIKIGDAEGTAFTIDFNGREYLVTAKHVADGIDAEREIGIYAGAGWTDLRVQLVGHATGDVDISVLAAREQLTPSNLPMPATSSGVTYGQDVHFLGFPYGYLGKYVLGPRGYPLPFVKRAAVSLLDDTLLLLDGHNNPGFSGGPVVFRKPNEPLFSVAAVISSYRFEDEPIYSGMDSTFLTYQYNTGIIEAYSIDIALKLVASNPIGCPTRGTV